MSIRILGGLAKSRSLFVPKGQTIRPTSVLLKRRVFDSIQDFSSYRFWDLCAGTGAVGLEAWSRGAQELFLNEPNREVYRLLKKNIEVISKGLDPQERPIRASNLKVEKWFKGSVSDVNGANDILFLDPPYELHSIYKEVGPGLIRELRQTQQLWIESDKDKGLPLSFWEDSGFTPYKVFKQGGSYIALFAKR